MGRDLSLLEESPDFLKGKTKNDCSWKSTARPCPDASTMWAAYGARTTCYDQAEGSVTREAGHVVWRLKVESDQVLGLRADVEEYMPP